MQLFTIPSFYAHALNGFLLLLAVVLILQYQSQITKMDLYKKLCIVLLLSIAVGIHGQTHLGLELGYQYNPFDLLWGKR